MVRHIPELLTFCDDERYAEVILNNESITSLFTTKELAPLFAERNIGLVSFENPRYWFFHLHNVLKLGRPTRATQIGEGTELQLGANVAQENVKIGKNCLIEDGVIIKPNVTIGDNVVIRSGSIIGGQGFQFWKNKKEVLRIDHFGDVQIGDNVEFKEYCTVHCAVFNWDTTRIGDDTKADAHAHVGHSNKVGKRVYLCSHSNISGNSVIEDDCYIGPGSNIPNRITIHSGAKVSVGATVTRDVATNSVVSGNFAIPHQKFINHIKRLIGDLSL